MKFWNVGNKDQNQNAEEFASMLSKKFPISTDVPPILKTMFDTSITIIKHSASKKELNIIEKTPILYLGASDLDACCLKVPDSDEAVICIGVRYVTFIYIMSRIFYWLLINNKDIKNGNDKNPEKEFGHVLTDFFAYLTIKKEIGNFDYTLGFDNRENNDDNESVIKIFTCCLSFVISHEISHVIEGHYKNAEKKSIKMNDLNMETCSYQQKFEFIADEKAFELIRSKSDGFIGINLAPFIISIINLALDQLVILTEATSNKVDVKTITSTKYLNEIITVKSHPIGEYRFQNLLNKYSSKLPKNHLNIINFYREFVIFSLWELDDQSLDTIGECATRLIKIEDSYYYITRKQFMPEESEY